MRSKFLTVSAGILAASLALAAITAPAKIVWKPKVDSELQYKLKAIAKIDFGGTPADVEISAKIQRKIKEVKEDGKVVSEEKQSDFVVMAQGTPVVENSPTVTSTTTAMPNGEVIESKSDAPGEAQSPRMELAYSLIFPDKELNVGDSYGYKKAANAEKGTYSMEYTFTYAGEEEYNGVKVYKITSESKETDAPTNMTGKGTFWIRQEDGEVLKSVFSVKNAPLQAEIVGDIDATLEVVK